MSKFNCFFFLLVYLNIIRAKDNSNYGLGETEDSTKEVLYKPLIYEKILTGGEGWEVLSLRGQHHETQKDINIYVCWGRTSVNRNLVWMKLRQCGGAQAQMS